MITGGAGGIGRAVAHRFAAEGAGVRVVDRDEVASRAVAHELGGPADHLTLDVSDATSGERIVARMRARFGRVDVAVLNAGTQGPVAPLVETPLDQFDHVIAVNVRAVWIGIAALLPAMRRGGSIIVTSSTGGLRGAMRMAAYTTSKHAVIGLVKSAALEAAAHGIRINAINPAPIGTAMMDAIAAGVSPAEPAAAHARMAASIPLGRYGTPEEVANMALFLASDEASFCTGGCYLVDGGAMAGPGR